MINNQAAHLFGKDAPALTGHPVYHLISPGPKEYQKDCLVIDTTFPPLESGEPCRTDDGLLMAADGQLVPISLVVTPMFSDGEVIGAVLVFRDISHQKQVESERQRTEDLLRRIHAGLSELTKSPQIHGANLQEAFQTVTHVAARCLHTERASIWFFTRDRSAIQCVDLYQLTDHAHSQGLELSAATYPRYFQELDSGRVVAADDAQRDPRTVEFTEGYLAPLGITSVLDVPILSEGKMIGVIWHEHVGTMRRWTREEQYFAESVANTVALAIEAANRRKVEQALRTSEERLMMTVQSANIGIWDWDLKSNDAYLSPEWKRQLGYEDHELRETFAEWKSRLHPKDYDRVWHTIDAYFLTRPSRFELEHRLRHKDGSYRWILARGTAIKSEAALSTRMVGINMDVTDQKMAEETLRLAKEAAEAVSRAKSQFLANMSHEIRTPMNGILGMTELLLTCPLNDKEHHLAESIYRSGTVLLAIINDILDFSKIEAGKLRLEMIPFEVRRTIREAVDLLALSVQKKQLTLSCHIDSRIPPTLLGDPMRLRQIIVNLVGNAIKFTEHGTIDVLVVHETHQQKEHYGLSVTITDTGIGIAPEVQAHIFDAFSQADGSMTRKYGGTGLGLAIVKQLVALMGGHVELQSSLGKGASFRFTVYFKRHETSSDPRSSPSANVSGVDVETFERRSVRPEAARILLVEDTPVNRDVACSMLETFGCRIDMAENGREAVAMTAEQEYALIFMDYQMPEMDGLTATKLIREREAERRCRVGNGERRSAPRVSIIALTAHAMPGDRELCLAAGMDDYLTKPFTISQLEQMLIRWLPQPTPVQVHGGEEMPPFILQPSSIGQRELTQKASEHEAISGERTIIDQAVFAAIRALQRPNRPDIVARVLSQYIEISQEMINRIRRAIQLKDAAELRATAHQLKSSSAQLGAVALAAACRELEMMGVSQELDRADETLSKMERHYAAVREVFERELVKGRTEA
ncbi:MAG: ATP-binding protein [Nitrospira sp.]